MVKQKSKGIFNCSSGLSVYSIDSFEQDPTVGELVFDLMVCACGCLYFTQAAFRLHYLQPPLPRIPPSPWYTVLPQKWHAQGL